LRIGAAAGGRAAAIFRFCAALTVTAWPMFHMGVTVTMLLLPVIGDPLLAMMQSL
jgi:hypothetical protein